MSPDDFGHFMLFEFVCAVCAIAADDDDERMILP